MKNVLVEHKKDKIMK